MNFTKQSKILIDFILKNKCIQPIQHSNNTTSILKKFFLELQNAKKYLEHKKRTSREHFYTFSIRKISHVQHIKKPSQFNSNSFPEDVRKCIDERSEFDLCYTFSLFDQEVVVHFIVEDEDVELHIDKYNIYIEKIFIWLHFIRDYSSRECARHLTLFFYFTSLKKILPENNIHIIGEHHVNTGFTYTCPAISEIVIYRNEEWFKVLLHETFHNFGLDFSDMNTEKCNKKILSIFQVESEVNLYEAYTEFWAETLNAVFCSYFSSIEDNIEEYIENCYILFTFEKTYGFFQLVKTLTFMGLTYKDLYSSSSDILRKTLYKEGSNVLSYYVLKTILFSNFNSFLNWSNKNNLSLLQFKKTIGNLDQFCLFIEKNYKTRILIEGIKCMEDLFSRSKMLSKKSKKLNFVWTNMRMTVCEME